MKKRTRTRITFETERLLVISRRLNLTALCSGCGGQSRMVTVDEAAVRARVNSLAIYRLVEAGALHFTETTAGGLLVCATSLGDLISNRKG